MRPISVFGASVLLFGLLGSSALGDPSATSDARLVESDATLTRIERLRVTKDGRILEDTSGLHTHGQGGAGLNPFSARLDCPQVYTHTQASFTGGTYVIQAGFAQGEIAATSFTIDRNLFPAKITLIEGIFAQQNAIAQTTTRWSVLVWVGNPTDPQPSGFPLVASSDPDIGLPHLVMGPGTQGTNIQFSIDPNDPDQWYIPQNPSGTTQTFTVGYRIDLHNSQTANPCVTPPPSNRNAFPTTDNTQTGCCIGYSQLNFPGENWLYGLNCGANGCPPNGGWTRFSGLQSELCFSGICLSQGCRPHGDWVIRVTIDPVNCPPPTGACCFGTAGCFETNQSSCTSAGGTFRGPGTTCGTNTGSGFPGCITPPNQPPVANAGPDQTVTDTDNNGSELVSVDGSLSFDPDGFIASYRWSEGATVLQDGPAFMQTALAVGVHTLTLRVTDSGGATATDTVVITVNPGQPHCPADLDDDGDRTNGYHPDGGVDINDLIAFLAGFEAGDTAVDLDDDGQDPGQPDGGVDINDLIYLLIHFESGC